ncbi:hypothetical protein RRG08_038416 [Elysia crispata]|uniref:Uncharacterized protein n=1 Tax=Elysia crispata TaxID=231223 RepID=A0AAE1AYL5_9GAST|nr:hypothetical protein RRG08_038416 [Elysia crispata]
MHNTPDVSAANRKPDIVLEYNEANDGVDDIDKMANVFIPPAAFQQLAKRSRADICPITSKQEESENKIGLQSVQRQHL